MNKKPRLGKISVTLGAKPPVSGLLLQHPKMSVHPILGTEGTGEDFVLPNASVSLCSVKHFKLLRSKSNQRISSIIGYLRQVDCS